MENLNLFVSILSGLVMGILANILTPYATSLLNKVSESSRKRSEHKNAVFEKSVQYLIDHPYDEINLRTEKNGRYMRAFILFSAALIIASFGNFIISIAVSIPLLFFGMFYFAKGQKYDSLVSATWRQRKQAFPEIDLN